MTSQRDFAKESMFDHLVFLLLQSALARTQHGELSPTTRDKRLDFYIRDAGDRVTAIEVRGRDIIGADLRRITTLVEREGAEIDRFLLVTPRGPSDAQSTEFSTLLGGLPVQCKWVSIVNLLPALGLGESFDLTAADAIAELQWRALVSAEKMYDKSLVGTRTELESIDAGGSEDESGTRSSAHLARQFPYHLICRVREDTRSIEDALRIGSVVANPVVLLSDIVSFSTLVRVSRPAELRKLMSSYYRRARQAVFRNGGILVQFIGDAVLAIWGYPYEGGNPATNALRCAAELVEIGRWLGTGFADRHDEVIPTGTRIGIATGELWVLDIGRAEIEVSFFGNVLNLAARLESCCQVNGALVSHRAKRALDREGVIPVDRLDLCDRTLKASEAKGQLTAVRSWQVPESGLERVRTDFIE